MCHPSRSTFLAMLGVLFVLTIGIAPTAAHAEQRIALVVGNASYPAGAINSAANDAGLIAQTLEAAGFEVTGARDLDQDALGEHCAISSTKPADWARMMSPWCICAATAFSLRVKTISSR